MGLILKFQNLRYTLEGHCVGNWNLSDVEEEAVRLLRSQLEHELSVFDSKVQSKCISHDLVTNMND